MASYAQEQRERAVALFNELGSAIATVRRLGYPSSQRLYAWVNHAAAAHRRSRRRAESVCLACQCQRARSAHRPRAHVANARRERAAQDGFDCVSLGRRVGMLRIDGGFVTDFDPIEFLEVEPFHVVVG